MPRTTFPTKHELRKLALMEPAMIFDELVVEATTWEGGFDVRTPDPVAPTFVEELRTQYYPELPSFEEDDHLEVVVAEIGGDPENLAYDVVRGTLVVGD